MLTRFLITGVLACGLLSGGALALADWAEAKLFQGRTAQGFEIELLIKENVTEASRTPS